MLASVTTVGDDFSKSRKFKLHIFKHLERADTVVDIRFMHHNRKRYAQRVNDQVMLPSFDFLVSVNASAAIDMVRGFHTSWIYQT